MHSAIAVLLVLGAGWGLAIPLTRIVVRAGYQPLGLIFWQLILGALTLALLRLMQRKAMALPLHSLWFLALIAILGTVVPNSFSYRAAFHLPAGVMAIFISMVPIFAFPIAMVLKNEPFGFLRLVGLMLGLAGVIALIQPDSLPSASMILWVPVALVAPLCYGIEGNVVFKWGTQGLTPGHLLFGASLVGSVLALPLAVGSGQFINPLRLSWGLPEAAFVCASVIHVLVYSGYVWLVRRTGAVFAAQISYMVTASGVLWSMLLLGESYSPYVWLAMGLVMVGVLLVRPQRNRQAAAP